MTLKERFRADWPVLILLPIGIFGGFAIGYDFGTRAERIKIRPPSIALQGCEIVAKTVEDQLETCEWTTTRQEAQIKDIEDVLRKVLENGPRSESPSVPR